MINNTLFGKRIGTPVKEVTAPSFEKESDLPSEINPKILQGLQPLEEALICAVAKSTAIVNGETVPYAVSFEEGEYAKGGWWFTLLTSCDDGLKIIESEVNSHVSKFEESLRADTVSPMSLDGRLHLVCGWSYDLESVSRKEYLKKTFKIDTALAEKATAKKLFWRDIVAAAEKGSLVAKQFSKFECGISFFDPQRYDNKDSLRGRLSSLDNKEILCCRLDPRQSGVSTYERSGHVSSVAGLRISDQYIGGIPHDAGAHAIANILHQRIGNSSFSDAIGLYDSFAFLHAQGYALHATTLREEYCAHFVTFVEESLQLDDGIMSPYQFVCSVESMLHASAVHDKSAYAHVTEELKKNATMLKQMMKKAKLSPSFNPTNISTLNAVIETEGVQK